MARPDAAMIFGQELGGTQRLLHPLTSGTPWTPCIRDDPNLDHEQSEPVLVNENVFDVRDVTATLGTRKVKVGRAGAGGSVQPEKHVTHVHAYHRDARRAVHGFNLHDPASRYLALRARLANRLEAVAGGAAGAVKAQVVLAGDLNEDYPLPRGNLLEANGLRSTYALLGVPHLGTSKNRNIDYLMIRGGAISAVSHQVVTGIDGWDHNPLAALLGLTQRQGHRP